VCVVAYGKRKVVRVHAMKENGELRYHCTRCYRRHWVEVSGQIPRYSWTRRLGGPRGRQSNSCPCQLSKYGYLSCPTHSLVTTPTARFPHSLVITPTAQFPHSLVTTSTAQFPHSLVTTPTAQFRILCRVENNTDKKDLKYNTKGGGVSLFWTIISIN
jgi:hypothetical protein